jgi:hypothetical protein
MKRPESSGKPLKAKQNRAPFRGRGRASRQTAKRNQNVVEIDCDASWLLIFEVNEPVPLLIADNAATPSPTTAAVSTTQSTVTAPSSSLWNLRPTLNSFISLSIGKFLSPIRFWTRPHT